VQALLVIMCVVMIRHSWHRSLFFIHTFQLTGYKINEYWSWLRENWNSHVLNGKYALANVFLLAFLVYISTFLTETAPVVIISIILGTWFLDVTLYKKPQKKPLVFTHRIKRLIVPMVVLFPIVPIVGLGTGFRLSGLLPDVYVIAFAFLLADILIPFLIMIAGVIMRPVENYIQLGYIRKAQKKLASMPELVIIGITGSYGKTSTKFALAAMLQERFSVCFTPGSFNTPMGICTVINNNLHPTHQILILEMGARYEGNIRELCEIAKPNIAILTNIGIAHLETFGSQEVIARTKGEIIDALDPGDTAIVNADDERVMNIVQDKTYITRITAGIKSGTYRARNIRYDSNGCSFMVVGPLGEEIEVTTRLLGKHNVQNILLGFAVGSHLGMRMKTMAMAVSRMEPVEHRLELKSGGSYVVIDDAFNSNPVGASNAVEVLAAFETGRRVIVTPGMVELGDAEEQLNREFGNVIGGSGIEQVILVGPKRTRPIFEGILERGYPEAQVLVVNSLFEANNWLKSWLQPGDTVLYENDLPDTYNE
jgi:UDP-N-acetylmuramoyl-tripeptide--D-alanyl-D-alanine ligase